MADSGDHDHADRCADGDESAVIMSDCAPTTRRRAGLWDGRRSPSSLAIPQRRRSSAAYSAARRSAS